MSDGFDEGQLREAQPSVDAVARDRARAEIGQRLFGTPSEPHRLGRFVTLGRLGRGGMDVVYSVYDPVLDRRVALKLLRPGPTGDVEHMRSRLHREALALARLSHPNVVPVYDVGIFGLVRGYEPDIGPDTGSDIGPDRNGATGAAGTAGILAQMGSLDTLPLAPAGAEPDQRRAAGQP